MSNTTLVTPPVTAERMPGPSVRSSPMELLVILVVVLLLLWLPRKLRQRRR